MSSSNLTLLPVDNIPEKEHTGTTRSHRSGSPKNKSRRKKKLPKPDLSTESHNNMYNELKLLGRSSETAKAHRG
eukprot:TRINITY_DN8225_c0_g1_i1.p1 TRINITY_DN8225_c0_g1~~TRINITY_DN8225_c0_g1_i1.p1  ORF type:complete len:74 (+),score=8.55 TRINITY_DN8225_c0_g1_i1:85-306(+)